INRYEVYKSLSHLTERIGKSCPLNIMVNKISEEAITAKTYRVLSGETRSACYMKMSRRGHAALPLAPCSHIPSCLSNSDETLDNI
ncbi:hypothetical protein Bpfe_011230, partial [Biomphalaria pfeifferi]